MNGDGWDIAEPRADALIESLRAFGYTTESAIADLVDNSISAGATSVSVHFDWNGRHSQVRVSDNGTGLSEDALLAAMRPGSMSPLESRREGDLGRYGLGLKTASFSQSRELTVVTRPRGGVTTHVRRWDLDTVAASGQWRLLRTPSPTIQSIPPLAEAGTHVYWTKLDRLVPDVERDDQRAHRRFLDVIERVRAHLGSTFHRYLNGRNRIQITVNGSEVEPWDPFITSHPATQQLNPEELPFKGELILVKPYVLPHRSKLAESEAKRAAGARGWNQQQGFYIYRSGRLLVQGSWLGLGLASDEHTKLARLSVEFPSSLDTDWHVDVRKAGARPPGEIADSLTRIARSTRSRAEQVYRHKGMAVARSHSQDFVFAWEQYRKRDSTTAYRINRKHPLIAGLLDARPQQKREIESTLRFIEETLPTTLIGVNISQSVDDPAPPFKAQGSEVRRLVDFCFRSLCDGGTSAAEAIQKIMASEPFIHFPEVVNAYWESADGH